MFFQFDSLFPGVGKFGSRFKISPHTNENSTRRNRFFPFCPKVSPDKATFLGFPPLTLFFR